MSAFTCTKVLISSRSSPIQVLQRQAQLFRKSYFSTSSNKKSMDVSGIYPPICTPFNQDESIAFNKLEENMQKWNKIPFKGYTVLGSNGECAYLRWEEKVDLVKAVKKHAAPGKLIMAGVGLETTRDTVKLSKDMAQAGADVLLVLNPHYYKGSMNARAMIKHFNTVADESPLPILLYNVPANTGLDIPPEVVIKCAEHPNIIGMKDSGGDISRIASLISQTSSQDFQMLAGSAGFLLAGYNVGCVGGVCALANVLGEAVCDLEKLALSNDMKSAMDLQLRLVGPNAAVTKKFGVPGLKKSMDWFGYFGGPTRSPLVLLEDNEITALQQIFKRSLFL